MIISTRSFQLKMSKFMQFFTKLFNFLVAVMGKKAVKMIQLKIKKSKLDLIIKDFREIITM